MVICCFSKTQAKAPCQVGDTGRHQEGWGTGCPGQGWASIVRLPSPKASPVQGLQQTTIPLPSHSQQHQLLTARAWHCTATRPPRHAAPG